MAMRRGDSPAGWRVRSLALILLMLTTLFVGAPTAQAQPAITVEAGFGGQHRSGTDLLVQVEIEADRLTTGEIVISSRFGERSDIVVIPVELAGGARKRFAAVVPSMSQGMGLTVQLVEGGDVLASKTVSPRVAQEDELVGVLPSLAADAPATAELAVPLGKANFAPVTETILAAGPGAIDALGIIVGSTEDLTGLSPVASAALQSWIQDGGDLVVNDGAGPVPVLNANADSSRTAIGRGSVRAVSGALAGSWDGVLFPSSMPQDPFGPGSMTGDLTGDMIWFGGPLANTLARDSGFGLPSLGVVLPIMAAYVLIVGPLAFIVLRRMGRPQLLWVALPILAFLFTAGVWIAGTSLRSNTTDAHGSVIEVTEDSATARSAILRSSRSGGTTTLALPEAWRATVGEDFRFGPNMGGHTTRLVGGTSMVSDLDAGGFVLLSATGPAPDFAGALTAEATSSENATITGTVTNNLDVTLEEVAVFTPFKGVNIGTVAAGETVTFVLEGAEANPRFGEPVDLAVWGNSFEPDFGPFGPLEQIETIVSMELWGNYMSANVGRAREPGTITVAGWTRDLASPLDGSIDKGRTAVIARADIEAVGIPITDVASRRTLLRGMEQTGFNQNNFGPGFTVTTAWRFDVPDDLDVSLIGLEVPQSVTELGVWDGVGWIELEDVQTGMYLLPPNAFIEGSLYVKPTVDFERNPMLGRDFSLHLLTDTNNIRSELLDVVEGATDE